MVKRKSCGSTGPFSAGSVVWVPYKGIQWPAVISRLYASQKKVTYKFLPLDENGGVFNAPVSKIRPFLLKDQLPEEGDDKLKVAYEAALGEVTKQRLEKGESLNDPESEPNEDEQFSDAAKKRYGKVEEKSEPKKIGQKDFEVGDIVLVSWFGYAEWPGIVLAVRKRTVACHFFPLNTGQPGWCRKSACQEFNIDQKTFTAMRRREATRERQLALDEAWELMTNTTKDERRECYKQKCETIKLSSTQSMPCHFAFESEVGSWESELVSASANNGELISDVKQEESVTSSSVNDSDFSEKEKVERLEEKFVNNTSMGNRVQPSTKKRKATEDQTPGMPHTAKLKADEATDENPISISHFDYAMEKFLKDYSISEGNRKKSNHLGYTQFTQSHEVGLIKIEDECRSSKSCIEGSYEETSSDIVIRNIITDLITQLLNKSTSKNLEMKQQA